MSTAAHVPEDRSISRVRHETLRRVVEVTAVDRIGPHAMRVTVAGESLRGFASPGFDDHVKLFVPPSDGGYGRLATAEDGQLVFDASRPQPAARDFTPHGFDPASLSLQLDFALHDAGPATGWATAARTGEQLVIGGPRGSFLIGTGFDWHMLIGDETALPAIRRRLAELPAGKPAVVLVEVDGPADEVELPTPASAAVHWIHRGTAGSPNLAAATRALAFPPGDFHAWIACEAGEARAIRSTMLERGADPKAMRAAGYWRRGAPDAHEVLE